MTPVAIIISLISLIAWVTSSTVWAWGAEGHEAICEIAYQELSREARTQVDAIMAAEDDDRFKTFRQGCGWPDHRRQETNERREDHYINRDYQDLYKQLTTPALGLSRTACGIGSPTLSIWCY